MTETPDEDEDFDCLEDDGSLLEVNFTPKGFLFLALTKTFKANRDQCNQIWEDLEAFCYQQLGNDTAAKDFEFAAIVLDGVGGEIIGVDLLSDDGEYDNSDEDDEDGDFLGSLESNDD